MRHVIEASIITILGVVITVVSVAVFINVVMCPSKSCNTNTILEGDIKP